MKNKLLSLLLAIILLVSIPGSIMLASDITGALYKMSIIVSNNDTLANYVSTNGVISTNNLIDGGFLNASANNCAVLDSADNDVPFMPGYNNPWCFWVETIGASSYINYDLYTADTTGGELAYFAADTGMNAGDDAQLEWNDSFEVNTVGFVDSTTSANQSLLYKDGAFRTYISDTDQVTSSIAYGSHVPPVVEGENGGFNLPNTLNHTVNLPASIADGELLIVVFNTDGIVGHTYPAGWVELFEEQQGGAGGNTLSVGYRFADGLEGASITVTTTGNEDSSYQSYRISGWSGIPEVGARATAASANPDPPIVTPSWGSKETLFMAITGYDSNTAITVYPTDYGDGRNDIANDLGDSCGSGTAYREINAASADPGTFTLAAADNWIAATLAIAPAPLEVVADNIGSDERTITTGLNSTNYDFSMYSGNTTVAVSMGGGMIPVFLLEEQELTAAAASVTFSNIDTLVANWDAIAGVTSRHLVVGVNGAYAGAAFEYVQLQFNGDTGANYSRQTLIGRGAAPAAATSTGDTELRAGDIPGQTTYANAFGGGVTLIPHAFNTVNHKTALTLAGAVEEIIDATVGRWASTDAITDVVILANGVNYITGSTFWLGVVDERYLVEEQLLVAPGTIDITTISALGNDLCAIGYVRGTNAAAEDELEIEFNNDGGGATSFTQRLLGTAAATSAASANDNLVGWIPGNNATANSFGAFVGFVSQYAETTNDPHYLTLNGYHETVGPTSRVGVYSGRWNNVAAVNQLEFYGNGAANLATGTLFSLYRVPRTVIDRQELTAPAATITFADIPQGYEALQLNVYGRTDRATPTDGIDITFNTDAVAANYDTQILSGTGAAVVAARSAASFVWYSASGATAGANEFSGGILTLPNYAKADRHKHATIIQGIIEDYVYIYSCRWEDNSPITRIDLDPTVGVNFVAGTIVELVGIFPQDVHAIEVDGDLYGIADGNGVEVDDNANDMEYCLDYAIPYLFSANSSGMAPHFTGAADSNINAGVIHDNETELWVSQWFKPDYEYTTTAPADQYLWGKQADANNNILAWLDTTGVISFRLETLGVQRFSIDSVETEWDRNQWYNVIYSISSTAGVRMIVDNGVAVTDADTTALFAGGDFCFGDFDDPGSGTGFVGVQANIAVGTDDLTTAEETGLYNGVIPADANNIWYCNEGTGVNIIDYGTDGNNATLDAGGTWVGSGSLIRSAWAWEYNTLFVDSIGSQDATPTFRTASSDPDVVATATLFAPIEEAIAPGWALSLTTANWVSAANVTGNFTTTPSPTYPGASVIEDISTATGTPAQLPFMIIFSFVTVAISLSISGLLRKHGSRSLVVKIILVGGIMGILEGVKVYDFWMVLFFLILALSILAASKQGEVV